MVNVAIMAREVGLGMRIRLVVAYIASYPGHMGPVYEVMAYSMRC